MQDSNGQIPKISLGQDKNQIAGSESNTVVQNQNEIPRISVGGERTQEPGKFEKVEVKSMKPRRKVFIYIILIFLVFLVINSILLFNVYRKANLLLSDAKALKDSLGSQNFDTVSQSVGKTRTSLGNFEKSYRLISWMKLIPLVGIYVDDGIHITKAAKYGLEVADMMIEISRPYSDLLGFSTSDEPKDGGKTAADRIDFLANTIPDIIPKLADLTSKLESMDKEIGYINPSQYPVRIGKREVRSQVIKGIDAYREISGFLVNGKPLLENAPYLLGLDSERTYLVIFQNDKELRPSGGFITAYSLMKVRKAKFEPVSSDDIYNLDRNYKPSIDAPEPIVDYLKGPYVVSNKLWLRDMNWSPDFEKSMDMFWEEIQSVGIDDADGIIAVDTQLLVNLLDVLGPIGVAGFGNYSTEIIPECNCPQVIHELESFADVEGPIVWDPAGTGKIIYKPPNTDNRKKIIGPLMNAIMANALGQPKEKIPDLFDAVFKSVNEKHILLFVHDENVQEAARKFGIAGNIKDYQGDYLHINDANLGGRKSNLYVTQSVIQEISLAKDGSVEKTLEITYQNPEEYDGWLNSVLPNWVRIYVPKGSELIESRGLEGMSEPYEDLGKTVFAGYFELRPQGVQKVFLKYRLPLKFKDEYKIFIQKQAGTNAPLHTIKVGKQEEEVVLNADKELKFKI